MHSLLGAEGMHFVAAHPLSNKWDIITYGEFKKELKLLFEHSRNSGCTKFDMCQRMQGINETVNDYVTVLHMLVAKCDI